ncbi:hypothetical protein Tco_0662985 [Tanacetum coccineum]
MDGTSCSVSSTSTFNESLEGGIAKNCSVHQKRTDDKFLVMGGTLAKKVVNHSSLNGAMVPMDQKDQPLRAKQKVKKELFQSNQSLVITDQPIKNILSNPEVAGRMQKWSIQLGEFGIHYRPRISVKGQVLAFYHRKTEEEDPRRFRKRKGFAHLSKQVLVEELKEKSERGSKVVHRIEVDWGFPADDADPRIPQK